MVDTNVLISAGIKADSLPRVVVEWIADHGVLLASKATLAEFESRYLGRSKLNRYATPQERADFVLAVSLNAEWVEVRSRLRVSPDPHNDTT